MLAAGAAPPLQLPLARWVQVPLYLLMLMQAAQGAVLQEPAEMPAVRVPASSPAKSHQVS